MHICVCICGCTSAYFRLTLYIHICRKVGLVPNLRCFTWSSPQVFMEGRASERGESESSPPGLPSGSPSSWGLLCNLGPKRRSLRLAFSWNSTRVGAMLAPCWPQSWALLKDENSKPVSKEAPSSFKKIEVGVALVPESSIGHRVKPSR